MLNELQQIKDELTALGSIKKSDIADVVGKGATNGLVMMTALKTISEADDWDAYSYACQMMQKAGWNPDTGATLSDFQQIAAAYELIRTLIITAPAFVTTFKKMRKWLDQNLA